MMKIPEELLPVVEWWEKHGKKAIVVAVIAAVAGVAYWAWSDRQARAKAAAADAISSALGSWRTCMQDPNNPAAAEALQNLQDTIATFGSSGNAALMNFILADAYCRRGNAEAKDYENADAIYSELLDKGSELGLYKEIPAIGHAQSLEAQGKFAEALEAFDRFAKDTEQEEGFLTLNAKLGAARCLAQLGKKDEAIARLTKLQDETKAKAEALKEKQAPDMTVFADAAAIGFTLDLVKRWVPASERKEAVAAKPVALSPVAAAPAAATPVAEVKPAETKPAEAPAAVEAKPAEAPAAAPAEKPAAPATTEAK